jgi:hypothetical protein
MTSDEKDVDESVEIWRHNLDDGNVAVVTIMSPLFALYMTAERRIFTVASGM